MMTTGFGRNSPAPQRAGLVLVPDALWSSLLRSSI
jgi:hypothetical protein